MQIVVTDPDSLPVARREVDAELDTIEAAASRFRPDSEINVLAASAGRPTAGERATGRAARRRAQRRPARPTAMSIPRSAPQ